jgi:hypothetical protein
MRRIILSITCCIAVSGCVPTYTLVAPSTIEVSDGSMSVTTAMPWNKVPKSAATIPQEENWTQNGPALDSVTFIGGVSDGSAIAKQKAKDDRQVPVFTASMTPPDLVGMVESYCRITLSAIEYETTNVQPATFLGSPGMQIDYQFIGGDDVKRLGRSMLVVVSDELYLISMLGTQLHYYDAALPEFESIVRSASIN